MGTKIRIGRANSLDVNAHHHHARRSSRLRPRRVAFLAFRLARFSPVGGARSPKRRVTARGGFKVREICRRISTRRKEVGIRFLVGTIEQINSRLFARNVLFVKTRRSDTLRSPWSLRAYESRLCASEIDTVRVVFVKRFAL